MIRTHPHPLLLKREGGADHLIIRRERKERRGNVRLKKLNSA